MGSSHQILARKVRSVLGKDFPVKSAYLYGSQLTGFTHADSDTDILILTNIELPLELTKRKIHDLAAVGISAFIFSERNFSSLRNETFFFAASLETAARTGSPFIGKAKLSARMNDAQVTRGAVIMTMVLLSQWQNISKRADVAKLLTIGSLLIWQLEMKVDVRGNFSLGYLQQEVWCGGDVFRFADPFWDYIEQTGILWRWLDRELFDETLPESFYELWLEELRKRLLVHKSLIQKLIFAPLPSECLPYLGGIPLYNGVPWETVEPGIVGMGDRGERYLVNLVRLCFRN